MLKKKTKKKSIVDIKWIIIVTICAFFMSVVFSSGMEIVTNKLSLILGGVLIVCVIIIGVLFDIVGVAITACDIKPFNSMAAKKVRGSKTAIELIKNSPWFTFVIIAPGNLDINIINTKDWKIANITVKIRVY